MTYTEAQKLATYRYRAKVKETAHFKDKVREYTARGWKRKKDDAKRLDTKRTYEREAYRRRHPLNPDRVLPSIRLLFV